MSLAAFDSLQTSARVATNEYSAAAPLSWRLVRRFTKSRFKPTYTRKGAHTLYTRTISWSVIRRRRRKFRRLKLAPVCVAALRFATIYLDDIENKGKWRRRRDSTVSESGDTAERRRETRLIGTAAAAKRRRRMIIVGARLVATPSPTPTN